MDENNSDFYVLYHDIAFDECLLIGLVGGIPVNLISLYNLDLTLRLYPFKHLLRF